MWYSSFIACNKFDCSSYWDFLKVCSKISLSFSWKSNEFIWFLELSIWSLDGESNFITESSSWSSLITESSELFSEESSSDDTFEGSSSSKSITFFSRFFTVPAYLTGEIPPMIEVTCDPKFSINYYLISSKCFILWSSSFDSHGLSGDDTGGDDF